MVVAEQLGGRCFEVTIVPREFWPSDLQTDIGSMIHHVNRMISQPEGESLNELDRDRLGNALAFLDDQFPIDDRKITSAADLVGLADRPHKSNYGQPGIDIDKALAMCNGLERYQASAPDLQGQAFHLVVKLESFHARLMEDLLQPEIPKKDLEVLKAVLESIECAL